MSIASDLQSIAANIATILGQINTKLVSKGSTNASTIDDVPEKIDAIEVGITPAGTVSITENGTVDVTNYASASVNVPEAILTAMDGGHTTTDGCFTAQSANGTTLSFTDSGFDGTNVVGCFVFTSAFSDLQRVFAMLILPTEFTTLGGVRTAMVYKDMLGVLHILMGAGSEAGFDFTVGEHSISITIPSSSATFITGTDYSVYPIRGNGRA